MDEDEESWETDDGDDDEENSDVRLLGTPVPYLPGYPALL